VKQGAYKAPAYNRVLTIPRDARKNTAAAHR
jgi:hypothetical protein